MSPDPRVYGFASAEDLRRYADYAARGGRPDLTGNPQTLIPGGVREAKVYVTTTGPKLPADRRNIYPAVFWVRNTNNTPSDPASQDWFGVGRDQYLDQRGNDCVAVTPNGEVLRKNQRYEGRVVGTWECDDPDPPVYTGILTVRTNEASGSISIVPPNGLTVGQTVHVIWVGGQQSFHGITSVVGNTVVFSGGGGTTGDIDLPAEGTQVTVRVVRASTVTVVAVDLSDASGVVRVASSVPDPDTGLYDAYFQQAVAEGNAGLEDGERIWVTNYGTSPFAAGHHSGAQFVTRLGDGGRAVYAVATRAVQECAAFVPNKRDCISVMGDLVTSAVWDAATGGWKFSAKVPTGDGLAVAILVENEFNQLMIQLQSENATWFLNRKGCSAEGFEAFQGYYTPLTLQETDAEVGSGSGSERTACADQSISLLLKCVPCSLTCGEFGPFPPTMCVDTPDVAANPDATPDPAMSCSFYYGATFDPVTVVYGAAGSLAGTYVTYGLPAHPETLNWFGKGRMTTAYGAFDYAVEIWFAAGTCEPNITYHLPFIINRGVAGDYLTYRSFTLPFGTPSGYLELPPVGSFPITVPAGTVLPVSVCADNSGANAVPCPNGVPFPADYPTVARWAVGVEGAALALGPAVVYSGGCTDGADGGDPTGGKWFCVKVASGSPYGTGTPCVPTHTVLVIQLPGSPAVGGVVGFTIAGPSGGCNYFGGVTGGPYDTEAEAEAGCGS